MSIARRNTQRAVAILLFSAIFAVGGTWAVHLLVVRNRLERPWVGFYGAINLNRVLGIPVLDATLEPPPQQLEDPKVAEFCHNVAKRAEPYLQDRAARYDVHVSVFDDWSVRGWPFVSRSRVATVVIDNYPDPHTSRSSQYREFLAGQDGNSPILYGGLIGNWLFYLAISAALLYAAEKAIVAIMIRRQRRRHGFPVVMANED